jgi:hypothetical protein
MKRGQFIKMISASIVAGVVAPLCVLPSGYFAGETFYCARGVLLDNNDTPEEGTVIIQEGYGGDISLASGGKFERFKYRLDQEGNMYIRYLSDTYIQ